MMQETMTSAWTASKLGFEKCVEAIKDYVKIRFDR